RLRVRVGDVEVPAEAPLGAARGVAARPSGLLVGGPVPAEILRIEEVDAHGDPAMLARPPESRAALGEPGDRDRRVRPRPRLHVKADPAPGFRLGDGEVVLWVLAPPREPPAVALRPDPQDRLHALVADPSAGAVLRNL